MDSAVAGCILSEWFPWSKAHELEEHEIILFVINCYVRIIFVNADRGL
jgi:hypothetical protein